MGAGALAGPTMDARSPWKLGGLSVRELAALVWARIEADEIFDRAAALSYYFLFAMFPALLFLTTLLGLLPVSEVVGRLLADARRVLPPEAASVLATILDQVVSGARGSALSVGAVGALWGASRAIRSIITALNVVYGVTRPRPWWRRQLVSMVLTVAFSLFTLVALVLAVFGERIGRALAERAGLGGLFAPGWTIVHWAAVALCVLTALDLVYHLGPAVRPRWCWLSPGSALALGCWLLASLGLRFYVDHLGGYNATYGSIGGVILLVLWLYLGGLALLVGAEVNAVIARAGARRLAGAGDLR